MFWSIVARPSKMDKFLNLIDDEHLPDMGKYWRPLIPVKQDQHMTPDTFKEAVLNSEPVLELCRRYGGGDPTDDEEVRKNIKDILDEIAFKRNMTVIRFLGITLNKIVQQMTTGVYVNRPAILDVKRELAPGKCTVLYLPSHRSYADFVLMSYVCFAHDLDIPAIAAGMGNIFFCFFLLSSGIGILYSELFIHRFPGNVCHGHNAPEYGRFFHATLIFQ